MKTNLTSTTPASRRGDKWPSHRAKARQQRARRRRHGRHPGTDAEQQTLPDWRTITRRLDRRKGSDGTNSR